MANQQLPVLIPNEPAITTSELPEPSSPKPSSAKRPTSRTATTTVRGASAAASRGHTKSLPKSLPHVGGSRLAMVDGLVGGQRKATTHDEKLPQDDLQDTKSDKSDKSNTVLAITQAKLNEIQHKRACLTRH